MQEKKVGLYFYLERLRGQAVAMTVTWWKSWLKQTVREQKERIGSLNTNRTLNNSKELFFVSVGNNGIEVTFVGSFRDAHWNIDGRIGMMYGICFRITSEGVQARIGDEVRDYPQVKFWSWIVSLWSYYNTFSLCFLALCNFHNNSLRCFTFKSALKLL